MAKLIVEILDRNRSETRICRFDSFPVRVGRSYQNDLILSDPFVSPEHFILTEREAGYGVEDLDSDNGVLVNGARMTGREAQIASGETLKVGATSLRFLSPLHPVSPALKCSFWERPDRAFIFGVLAWASLIPIVGVFVMSDYLTTYSKVGWLELINESIPVVMILSFGWASFWSLIGYCAQRRTKFLSHVLVFNAFILTIELISSVPEYIAFSLNCPVIETIGGYVALIFLFTGIIFCSLGIATAIKRRRRMIIAASIPVVILFCMMIGSFADKSEFYSKPTVSSFVKPPYVKLASSQSVSTFLDRSHDVFLEEDSAAATNAE